MAHACPGHHALARATKPTSPSNLQGSRPRLRPVPPRHIQHGPSRYASSLVCMDPLYPPTLTGSRPLAAYRHYRHPRPAVDPIGPNQPWLWPASLHEALATSTPAIRSPPHLLIALTQLVQPATVRGPFNSSCEPTSMQVCIQSTNKSYADPYVRASCEPPRTPSPAFSLSCTPSHSLLSRQTLLAS